MFVGHRLHKYGAGMMWTKNRRHLILKDGSHVPFWDGAEQTTETGQKAKKDYTS